MEISMKMKLVKNLTQKEIEISRNHCIEILNIKGKYCFSILNLIKFNNIEIKKDDKIDLTSISFEVSSIEEFDTIINCLSV